jgi:hypothetical protein
MHQPERWGFVRFSPRRGLPADTDAVRAPPPSPPPLRLAGYAQRVAGALIAYHSPHPEADTALLARARRDVQSVTWRTEPVPDPLRADTVVFVWATALSGSKGVHRFDLRVNGYRPCFTFHTAADSIERRWSVPGCRGGTLTFQPLFADRFGDLFGWMFLRLPRAAVTPGEALELTVTGEDAESSAWYMTFEHRLAARPRVRQDPVLLRGAGGPEAALRVVVDDLDGRGEAVVEVGGRVALRQRLVFGGNALLVPAGMLTAAADRRVVVRVGDVVALDTTLRLEPVAQRDVYLLPYSHNDVGYSHVQEEVLRIQWRNLDSALALIARTRALPEGARYRWNVEQLWPVRSWLAQAAPEQREAFLGAVREGAIGLNALTAGVLSGLATLPEMAHFLDDARWLRRTYGLPITVALISDIPGQSWGMVRTLREADVRYFALAPNAFDRIGYATETWGDRPFWWVSASGRDSVLLWVAGSSYSPFHMAPLRIAGEKVLFTLMRRLGAQAYPYRHVQLPYTIDGDNGPNDPALPDVVRAWNERYASPRLLISTHGAMFADFAAEHGARLPAFRGDFTGYWEDGAASSAREVAMVRRASDRLVQAEAAWTIRRPRDPFPAADADTAWWNVTLWDEHTWGAAASVSDPDAPDVVQQWRYKQAFALRADSISRALLAAALTAAGRVEREAFDVVNTADHPRTDLVLVPAALSSVGDRVTDARGREVPSQRLSTGELAVLVRDVPARGVARYRLRAGAAAGGGAARAAGLRLESTALVVTVDSISGAIASIVVRPAGRELVDRTHRRGVAEYLYVPGRDTTAARGVSNTRVRVGEPGPLVAELVITSDAPGARSLERRVRVVDGLDRVDFAVTVDKLAVREKEGVHLAVPLHLPGGQFRFDVADGVVRPDVDQLAGSSRNTVNVQSWVDLSADGVGVTWATPDAPLLEIGGLLAEQLPWLRRLPATQTFFSYVMNNYWHTNYRADQEGPVAFRYALRPHAGFDAREADRFGMGVRRPLLVTEARGRVR